jgi:pimeloyl-ACP methyl ester carboxylesterase
VANFAIDGLQRVAINGTNLAYLERGHGDPVVFVHGGYSDLRTWMPQIAGFPEKYRAITYSRRFARPNTDIGEGQDDQMVPHVEDLCALIRALDLGPSHLVGNSWGAFICLLAALREPTLVRTLVLGEPPALPLFISNDPAPGEILRLFMRNPRTALAIMRFAMKVIQPTEKAYRLGDVEEGTKTFVKGVLGADAYDALPEARRDQMRENQSADVGQMLGAGFPPLSESDVQSIRTPTLLVTGERSPSILRRVVTDKLEALLPNVERVEISAASHIMHEENSAAYNDAVLNFLQSHS